MENKVKEFKRNELLISIILIVIYSALFTLGEKLSARVGIHSSATAVFNWGLSFVLLLWIRRENLLQYYGLCAIVLKRTGKVIGSDSVRYDADLGGFTFGYNVNRRYWGNGYATEAAKAMISWARKELGVTVFIAVYADDNVASGNVIRGTVNLYAQNSMQAV